MSQACEDPWCTVSALWCQHEQAQLAVKEGECQEGFSGPAWGGVAAKVALLLSRPQGASNS